MREPGPAMALETRLTCQDELLIAVALFEYSRLWAGAELVNGERAWFLCRIICERHGLTPSEACLQLD